MGFVTVAPQTGSWAVDLKEGLSTFSSDPTLSNENRTARAEPQQQLSQVSGIPPLEEITPPHSVLEGHFLRNFIIKPSPLTTADIKAILHHPDIDLHINGYVTGSIPAAANPATDYSCHSWTRDSVITACAVRRAGDLEKARQILENLAFFYGREEQRSRFVSFHSCPDPAARYARGEDLPHIRQAIDAQGNLVESPDPWGHAQLDAIGMWLWASFRLAREEVIDLPALDKRITAEKNANNSVESIFVAALKFLSRIHYWEQFDHGPWESDHEFKRATSVGICVAALSEASYYFESRGWDQLHVSYPGNDSAARLKAEVREAINAGHDTLAERIPDNPHSSAVECESFPHDSAMLFLLYPFTPNLSLNQQHAILRTIYPLMGQMGFRRYDGDNYVGQDYPHNPASKGIFSDPTLPDHRSAEWPMFVYQMLGYHSRRFVESNGTDAESFLYADRFLKWGLALITPQQEEFRISATGQEAQVPRGTVPEGYWWDSTEERWRVNHNSPLYMAKALLLLGLERHLEALRYWEAGTQVETTSHTDDSRQ